MTEYVPRLTQIEVKTKTGGTIKRDHLDAFNALIWFYDRHPLGEGRILTDIISVGGIALMKATVYVKDVPIATGHADMRDDIRKSETAAIRRALANAGFSKEMIAFQEVRRMDVKAAAGLMGKGANRRIDTGVATPEPVNVVTVDPPKHWALNGEGEKVNALMHQLGVKWDEIKGAIEPGRTLDRLSDTTLSREQVEIVIKQVAEGKATK